MELVIKGGVFTLTGDIEKKPERSASGKSLVLASTRGFMSAIDDKGKEVKYSLNIITKDSK